MSLENPEIRQEAEKLNQEGWEDNAAIRVGKKEVMPQMVQQLETEGKTENLETYIKMNKKIVVPRGELNDITFPGGSAAKEEWLKQEKGSYALMAGNTYQSCTIFFLDKELNLAKVSILPTEGKINSLTKYLNSVGAGYDIGFFVRDELEKMGFGKGTINPGIAIQLENAMKRKIENEIKQGENAARVKDFNF